MYCSNCSGAVVENLSYCSHCGKKMTGANKLSEASFNTLVAGILAMPIAGIGVLIGLISVMKETLGFGNDVIIVFTAISFFLLVAAEVVFIWLLVRGARANENAPRQTELNQSATIENLAAAQPRELHEPLPNSVTEFTTRSLEPVLREMKK